MSLTSRSSRAAVGVETGSWKPGGETGDTGFSWGGRNRGAKPGTPVFLAKPGTPVFLGGY